MDRETAQNIRDNLVAMRNIVRLWAESGDADDAPLVLDWLRGLLGEVLRHYPAAVLFYEEFLALDDYLALAQDSLPADLRPFMARRLSVLVRAFDGIALARPVARVRRLA